MFLWILTFKIEAFSCLINRNKKDICKHDEIYSTQVFKIHNSKGNRKIFIFFQTGTVTNPTIWLVLSRFFSDHGHSNAFVSFLFVNFFRLRAWKKINKLFAGWEVRIVKNCDRGLENAARGLQLWPSRQIIYIPVYLVTLSTWFSEHFKVNDISWIVGMDAHRSLTKTYHFRIMTYKEFWLFEDKYRHVTNVTLTLFTPQIRLTSK